LAQSGHFATEFQCPLLGVKRTLGNRRFLAGPPITAWKIDRERYRAVPFCADGKPGPAIELRSFFAQFLNEVEGNK